MDEGDRAARGLSPADSPAGPHAADQAVRGDPLVSAFWAIGAATLLLMAFGATVRVHGAGLACPDWPLCFGQLVPQMDFRIFLEWGHRLVAGLISVVFLVAGVLVLRDPRRRALAGGLVIAAAVTLLAQIVLGGLTVLHLLAQWTVTSHLLAANVFLAFVLLIGRRLRQGGRAALGPGPVAVRVSTGLLAFATLVQLVLGGVVSSSYAGLVCTEWPTCFGGVWFPTFAGLIGLQVLHRLGAYAVVLIAIANAALVWNDTALRRPAALFLVLVVVQVVLGVANVILSLPVELAVLHSLVADGLFQTAIWLAVGASTSTLIAAPADSKVA